MDVAKCAMSHLRYRSYQKALLNFPTQSINSFELLDKSNARSFAYGFNRQLLSSLPAACSYHAYNSNFFGETGEVRTLDLRVKSPMLYRLSYNPKIFNIFEYIKSRFTTIKSDQMLIIVKN